MPGTGRPRYSRISSDVGAAEIVGGGETGTGGPLELLAQAACNGSAKTSWVEREYIWGPGDVDECLMQIGRQGELMFVLNDGNNNVVGLTGPTGAMLEQYTYEPYGALIRAESLATHPVNKLGHQGLFFDHFVASTDGRILVPETTGLYYNRNRHYSPTMGRFLQRDPNETGQPLLTALIRNGATPAIDGAKADVQGLYGDGMNLYQYVGSNPVTRRDPSGLTLLLDNVEAMSLGTMIRNNAMLAGGWGAGRLAQGLLEGVPLRNAAYDALFEATAMFMSGMTGDMGFAVGEMLLARSAAVVTSRVVADAAARLRINNRVGMDFEALALRFLGLEKNRARLTINGLTAIPDAITSSRVFEVKHQLEICLDAQLRTISDWAKANGREAVLVVSDYTKKISKTVTDNFIIWRIPG